MFHGEKLAGGDKRMNILLAGGSGRIMDAMIDKLNKGGHRVYLLTGQKEKKYSYKHVFERYNF